MKNKIQTGKRYAYKENMYRVIFISNMKIGEVWIPCVVYQAYKNKKVYVREFGDFFEKFTLVKDEIV